MSAESRLTIHVRDKDQVRIVDERENETWGRAAFDSLAEATIDVFRQWIENRKITRREELQVLGEHLYNVLFRGDIQLRFEKALAAVPPGQRLRVQLSFDASAAALAELPWEYLWYPSKQIWFSTAVEYMLSRFLPSIEGGRDELEPYDQPLRILVVVSEPPGVTPVIADPVIEAIEKLKERQAIVVDRIDNPSLDSFDTLLSERRPHVVHFMGHGRFQRDQNPPRAELALSTPDGAKPGISWCRDQDFAQAFERAYKVSGVRPRLVFLHLCESAVVDFNSSFAGMAPQLVRRANIPAVVAMQYPIENRYAIQFSRVFYELINQGESIDRAVQEARYRLAGSAGGYDNHVFGTPVLYLSSTTGIIRPSASGASTIGASSSSAAATGASTGPATRNAQAQTTAVAEPTLPTAASSSPATTAPPPGPRSSEPRRSAQSVEAAGGSSPMALRLNHAAPVNPRLRRAMMEARKQADERLAAMHLSAAERSELSEYFSKVIDRIKSAGDARLQEQIAEECWAEASGNRIQLVELLIKELESLKSSGEQEQRP